MKAFKQWVKWLTDTEDPDRQLFWESISSNSIHYYYQGQPWYPGYSNLKDLVEAQGFENLEDLMSYYDFE